MKEIRNLVPDIYELVKRKDGWFTNEIAESLSLSVSNRLKEQLSAPERKKTLRLSKMGPTCPKALWYSIHKPEEAEALPPWAEIKYSYGHILEALAIALCKSAGHEVTGEQDELILDGIVGHRDAVVDGCVVDFKSCSSIAFQKIKNRLLENNDSFGYLDQLDGYVVASADDPLVRVKDKGYIFAIDKTLGHCYLHEHSVREGSIRSRIGLYKQIVALSSPPECNCSTRPEGKSGNVILDTRASYSAFKYQCFPNLRCFLYASGPVYFTKVVRKPDVTEVDRHGKVVYN